MSEKNYRNGHHVTGMWIRDISVDIEQVDVSSAERSEFIQTGRRRLTVTAEDGGRKRTFGEVFISLGVAIVLRGLEDAMREGHGDVELVHALGEMLGQAGLPADELKAYGFK